MSQEKNLYKEFIAVYALAFSGRDKSKLQQDGNTLWNEMKCNKKVVNSVVKEKINELRISSESKKHKNLLSFFVNSKKTKENVIDQKQSDNITSSLESNENENEVIFVNIRDSPSKADLIESESNIVSSKDASSTSNLKRKAPAYKQDLLKSEIELLDREIAVLVEKQMKRILSEDGRKKLEECYSLRQDKFKILQKTQNNGKRKAKSRASRPDGRISEVSHGMYIKILRGSLIYIDFYIF